jgi:transcriptional regulator with XRE-family HTH domain
MTTKTRPATTDAIEILRRRYVDGDPGAESLLDEARAEADLARTLYRLRTEAKLTQQALAEQIGTTASVISRLEDADYTGHSLAMLRRIASALGRRVEIHFPVIKAEPTPKRGRATGAASPQTGKASKSGKPTGAAKISRAGQRSSTKADPSSK